MRQRPWDEIAKEIDASISDEAQAFSVIAELAAGMFPNGIPDLVKVTWADDRGPHADAEIHDPRADAEVRLKAAEERFRTLVEQIPAVTFMAVLGEGKNEIYVSPHIEQLLGYTQDEWLSDPFLWYWRLHPDDRPMWNDEFARGCRTGGPFRADCRFLARDGHVVWVHGEARLIRDELGRPHFLQGVAFDISDIKKAQEILVNEAVQRAKMEEELAIARRVQTSILPRDLDVSGLEIAARMVPAEDVGGDYYDVRPTKDGCWLGIGDVAGHGLDAGLVMLMVQSATATLTRMRPAATPRELLCALNETLYENIRQRLAGDAHVTFTLARYKVDGTLLFTGAHEDILVVRPDGEHFLRRSPGTWLGARPDIRHVTVDAALKLEPGDICVFYTDGLTEARNATHEQWDLPRLVDLVVKMRAEPVAKIVDAVFQAVQAWAPVQDDDRTMLVLRYTGR